MSGPFLSFGISATGFRSNKNRDQVEAISHHWETGEGEEGPCQSQEEEARLPPQGLTWDIPRADRFACFNRQNSTTEYVSKICLTGNAHLSCPFPFFLNVNQIYLSLKNRSYNSEKEQAFIFLILYVCINTHTFLSPFWGAK